MRTYDKQIAKAGVITFVMTLFLLVLLPAALVGLWGVGLEFGERGEMVTWNVVNGMALVDSLDGSGTAVPGSIDSDRVTVDVWRTTKKRVESIPLEEYVLGVVSSEMPAGFHEEALKAQAVAARTYGLAKIEKSVAGNPEAHPKAPLCDGTHCQVYRSDEELREVKGDHWMTAEENGLRKIQAAVSGTRGQVMYYQGELVLQPLFHSASGPRTENSEDVFTAAVPYLRSVESGQYENGAYAEERSVFTVTGFVSKARRLNGAASDSPIVITARSEGGRVESMTVGGAEFTGRQIRDLMGLRSANFTVQIVTDSGSENSSGDTGGQKIIFTTWGNGHGVGMSQYGADGMGKAGFGYRQILQHYYSGVEVR